MISVEGFVDTPLDSEVVPSFPAALLVRVPLAGFGRPTRVYFEGRVLVDKVHKAVEKLIDGDDIWGAFEACGMVGGCESAWLCALDQKAIVEAVQGILHWIGQDLDAYEAMANEWVCAHPGNRAFAARVMAGLSAGL